MTQEDKDLLLKDLCGRLPYSVICNADNNDGVSIDGTLNDICRVETMKGDHYYDCYFKEYPNHDILIYLIRPYLRPLSNMTQEEWEEWKNTFSMSFGAGASKNSFEVYDYVIADFGYRADISTSEIAEMMSWLNAHHFDYRGLIEKGLALEAPELLYKQ